MAQEQISETDSGYSGVGKPTDGLSFEWACGGESRKAQVAYNCELLELYVSKVIRVVREIDPDWKKNLTMGVITEAIFDLWPSELRKDVGINGFTYDEAIERALETAKERYA